MKRIVVAGCRDYNDYDEAKAYIDICIEKIKSKYGRCAGLIRNKEMAEVGDYIICFWDGKSRGTKSMIYIANRMGKNISVKFI